MKEIFESVAYRLSILTDFDVTVNESGEEYLLYFRKNKEIKYLINISKVYKGTLVLDTKTLVEICKLVLKNKVM